MKPPRLQQRTGAGCWVVAELQRLRASTEAVRCLDAAQNVGVIAVMASRTGRSGDDARPRSHRQH